MKIQFKRSKKLQGNTHTHSDTLGRMIAERIKGNILSQVDMNEILTSAKSTYFNAKDQFRPLEIEDFENHTITFTPKNTNGLPIEYFTESRHYTYEIPFTMISRVYECISLSRMKYIFLLIQKMVKLSNIRSQRMPTLT